MFKRRSRAYWVDGVKICKANRDVIRCFLIEMFSLPQTMVKYRDSKCDYMMIPIQKVSIAHGTLKLLSLIHI